MKLGQALAGCTLVLEAVAVPEIRNRLIFATTQLQRDTKGCTREPVEAVAYHLPVLRTARPR